MSIAMTGLPSSTNSWRTVPGRAPVLGVACPDRVRCFFGSSFGSKNAAMAGNNYGIPNDGGRSVAILVYMAGRDKKTGLRFCPWSRRLILTDNAGTCVVSRGVTDASRLRRDLPAKDTDEDQKVSPSMPPIPKRGKSKSEPPNTMIHVAPDTDAAHKSMLPRRPRTRMRKEHSISWTGLKMYS